MKVAIVGSSEWQSKRKIFEIFANLKKLPERILIIGAGGKEGANFYVKKYAIELGFDYIEYNPSYTGYNLYSAMPESYYGKKYHFSQLIHRMRLVADAADKMLILATGELDPQLDTAYKRMRKFNKPVVILT